MRRKLFVYLLLWAVATGSGRAQTAEDTATSSNTRGRLETHTLEKDVSRHIRIPYLLSLPNGYARNSDRYPLILYLHGGSVRGSDIDQMKRLGLAQKAEADPEFPFIVVSPQCAPGEIWTDIDALSALLDEVTRSYRVDPDRIYVTGHSMGGRGALYAAYKMPERFAGVISLGPVAPVTAWAEKLAGIPLWVFHGTKDQFTPLTEVEELIHAIEAAGGHPEFTVLPERDHYILDVYDRPDIYKWLAQQRKKHSD